MKKIKLLTIIHNLLTPIKRQPLVVAFLNVLTSPLQSFINWIADVYYPDATRRTKWNAQTMLFEKLLNVLHNPGATSRLIYINSSESDMEPTYFYNSKEGISVSFYNKAENTPLYLHNAVEYEPEFDFIVNYPTALTPTSNQIEVAVKKYKIAGTKYQMLAY